MESVVVKRRLVGFWLGALLCGGLSFPGSSGFGADPAAEPRLQIVARSAGILKDDTKFLVELSPTPSLRSQWEPLAETLDGFLEGVDLTKPVRLDVSLTASGVAYGWYVPFTVLEGRKNSFQNNLVGLGFTLKRSTTAPNRYELREGKDLRAYLRAAENYAQIAGKEADVAGPGAPPISPAMLGLLGSAQDLAMLYENTAALAPARLQTMKQLRTQLEANVKYKRGAKPAEIELRKHSTVVQLNELERFAVESEKVAVNWTTDASAQLGTGLFTLTALPDTSLMASNRQLGAAPSAFSAVQRGAKPVISGVVNFAADEMRVRHTVELVGKLRPVIAAEIAEQASLTPDGKAACQKAVGIALDVVESGAKELKLLDLLVDLQDVDGGVRSGVCAIRTVQGKRITEVVELLPKIRNDYVVKMNVASHGGVDIHEVTIPANRLELFQSLVTGATSALVGVSDGAVWGAAGPGALDRLKAAIDQAAAPDAAATGTIITGAGRFGPLSIAWEAIYKSFAAPAAAKPKTKEEIQAEKDRERWRKLAMECGKPGDDFVTLLLKRDGDGLFGSMAATKGFLRYLGAFAADFSKENLK